MKIHDIQDEYKNYDDVVKVTDFEHFFDLYEGADGGLSYNLNETLYLDPGSGDGLPAYISKNTMQWTTASYLIYGTTRLAWLLMKLNKVDAKDMFKNIYVGQKILYLDKDTVQSILDQIREV